MNLFRSMIRGLFFLILFGLLVLVYVGLQGAVPMLGLVTVNPIQTLVW